MKTSSAKIIPFPFSRRSAQNGLTQKGTPARWLGFLLLASVGAAWALNPSLEVAPAEVKPVIAPTGVVVEGEPEVVAQLLGSVMGPEATPGNELKGMRWGARVVLEEVGVERKPEPPVAEVLRLAEDLEAYASSHGNYPAGLSGAGVPGVSYLPSRAGFRLESPSVSYDSRTGLEVKREKKSDPGFRVGGTLVSQTSGWGPFVRESTQLQARPGHTEPEKLAWLETLAPAPDWSARMFFPVSEDVTGPLFHSKEDSTIYQNGEMTLDAVKGTFLLKLHRKDKAACLPLDSEGLESELGGGYGLVGDSAYLRDLGLGQPGKDEAVVHLSTVEPLTMSMKSELERLAWNRLSQERRALIPGRVKSLSADGSVALVGRLRVVDQMGQLHEVRLRGGRGLEYDWLVGQFCPLGSEAVAKHPVSQVPDLERRRYSSARIVAGK